MNSLLNKFASVTIENNTRISESDKVYCETQENMFNAAKEMITKQIILLMTLIKMNPDLTNDYYNINNIKSNIEDHEKKITSFKNQFVNNLFHYFKTQYNISLDSSELRDKYDNDITYNNIVDEIFEQLGGFNFNEKAVNEIKTKCRDLIYRDDKITVKKSKLAIDSFVWWDSSWEDKKRIGYSNTSIKQIFEGLSHYETDQTDILNYYNNIYDELYRGEEKYNIFSKYELGYNSVQSLKFFKNGKLEIEFQTNEQAQQFKNEYLTK